MEFLLLHVLVPVFLGKIITYKSRIYRSRLPGRRGKPENVTDKGKAARDCLLPSHDDAGDHEAGDGEQESDD